MDNWNNILDEEILKTNVSIASLFLLYFETLKDYIVDQIKDFYCTGFHLEGNKYVEDISPEYDQEVLSFNKKNRVDAFLKWLMDAGTINQSDYLKYDECRVRRNDITHQLLKNLNNGFTENDIKLLKDLIQLYLKIDKWWILNIELPTSGEMLPDEYDEDGVIGGQAIVLHAIIDVVLGNGNEYKDVLENLRKSGVFI